MTEKLTRTAEEIKRLLGECYERQDAGLSVDCHASYEDGIVAAVEWLTGQRDDHPLDDA